MLDKPITELADIDYTEAFNSEVEKQIKTLFSSDNEITYQSKLDNYDEMKQSEDQSSNTAAS